MVHIWLSVYQRSSAHVTAIPPPLTSSWMMEGLEERMAQSGGKRNTL